MTRSPQPVRERDLSLVADLVGDATRMAMLAELAAGRALPAGELARVAGVHPTTATAHLPRLVEGGWVRVRSQGRHPYHELAGPQVAAAIEALTRLAPPAPGALVCAKRAARTALAEARTCYDHLAGRRRVELRDRLLHTGALRPPDEHNHPDRARGRPARPPGPRHGEAAPQSPGGGHRERQPGDAVLGHDVDRLLHHEAFGAAAPASSTSCASTQTSTSPS